MTDICHETAQRLYDLSQEDQDPSEIIRQMELAIHATMFRIRYCQPRCSSPDCQQINGEPP